MLFFILLWVSKMSLQKLQKCPSSVTFLSGGRKFSSGGADIFVRLSKLLIYIFRLLLVRSIFKCLLFSSDFINLIICLVVHLYCSAKSLLVAQQYPFLSQYAVIVPYNIFALSVSLLSYLTAAGITENVEPFSFRAANCIIRCLFFRITFI